MQNNDNAAPEGVAEENTAPEGDTASEGASRDRRPLGFWLRMADRRLAQEFAAQFAEAGLDRREWMLLNLVAEGSDDERFARFEHRGGKVLRRLADRGLITQTKGVWTLTDEGRVQYDALKAGVEGIRERILGAIPEDEYARVVDSLQAVAREFGWDGEHGRIGGRGFGGRGFGPGFGRGFEPGFERPAPGDDRRGFGPRHGFRPGFGPASRHGFGPGHGFGRDWADRGFGPRHGFDGEHGHGEHGFDRGFGHGEHGEFHRHHGEGGARPEWAGRPGAHRRGHGEGRGDSRKAERAYERGFAAGFAAASRTTPQD